VIDTIFLNGLEFLPLACQVESVRQRRPTAVTQGKNPHGAPKRTHRQATHCTTICYSQSMQQSAIRTRRVVSLEKSRLNIARFDLRYDDFSCRYNFVAKTKLWRLSAASYLPRQVQPSGAQNLGQPPTHEIFTNFDPPMLLQSSFGLLISTCSFEDGYVHPGRCVMFCAKVFSDFFGNIPGDFLVDSACILTQDSRMCLPKRLSILAH
jgi:hypothetical protein